MSDPDRKARADRYRLKLMEQYLQLRDASEEELNRHEHELNTLLDNMGYFESPEEEPLRTASAKQKLPLIC